MCRSLLLQNGVDDVLRVRGCMVYSAQNEALIFVRIREYYGIFNIRKYSIHIFVGCILGVICVFHVEVSGNFILPNGQEQWNTVKCSLLKIEL